MTIVRQIDVVIHFLPHNVFRCPRCVYQHGTSCRWFVDQFAQQLLGCCGSQCAVWVHAVPRCTQSKPTANRKALCFPCSNDRFRGRHSSNRDTRYWQCTQHTCRGVGHVEISPVNKSIGNNCADCKQLRTESSISQCHHVSHLCATNSSRGLPHQHISVSGSIGHLLPTDGSNVGNGSNHGRHGNSPAIC